MAFIWGDGGAQLTPEAIAAQRKVAQAMMLRGADYSPVQSAWQGAARMSEGLVGGLDAGLADAAEKKNTAAEAVLLASLMPGAAAGAVAPPAVYAPTVAPPAANAAGPVVQNDGNAAPGTIGMNQRLADLSYDFIDDNPGTSISSGHRSTADQARLYAERGSNPNPVAFPGTSRHERGAAVDIAGMSPGTRAVLSQYGLSQPVANDPPHVELAPATQMSSADPAALPPNAQEAQGYVIPGQPSAAAQTVAQAMPQTGVNPALMRAYASPYVSEGTKKVLGMMLAQQMKPNEYGFQSQPDGTILRTDPRTGNVTPVYQGATKPTFTKIGTDPGTGQDIMGFVDAAGRKVEQYTPPTSGNTAPSTLPPVPAGVDPKVWRETFSKNAAQGATPGSFDDTSKLRSEFTQLPAYKNMAQAAPVYQSMRDAAGRDTKAADLNIVYGLGKIMDPGSVVREGEIQMANNAQGWQEKLNGIIGQINSKGALTPEGRQALMAEAHSRISSYKQQYDLDAGRYTGITERNRINKADVIPDFGTFEPWIAPKINGAPIEIDGYKIKAR